MPASSGIETRIAQLSDKQREVSESCFGLHGYRRSILEEVGNELVVARQRTAADVNRRRA